MNTDFDIIIIGCGAAGLAAAASATVRGRNVAIFDIGNAPARKVMASGGGRCNFTNMDANVKRYFGKNPDFVRSALAQTTPSDILEWAKSHNITPIEKASGQYFSESGAASIVDALLDDARDAKMFFSTPVKDVCFNDDIFTVSTNDRTYTAQSVIIATGGTSFGTLGVSDFGFQIAKKFGHKIIPPRPALCAIATDIFSSELAGISVQAAIKTGRETIIDSMLFTHFGIGGPAVYRTTVRDISDVISINLLPNCDVYEWLRHAKQTIGKKTLPNILAEKLPARVAKFIAGDTNKNIADYRDTEIRDIAQKVNNINIPRANIKLHNLASAEVIRGGIDTHDISSKTMESKLRSGLFFVGEVIDIAGDLGGFNLHWAWASGGAAGNNA